MPTSQGTNDAFNFFGLPAEPSIPIPIDTSAKQPTITPKYEIVTSDKIRGKVVYIGSVTSREEMKEKFCMVKPLMGELTTTGILYLCKDEDKTVYLDTEGGRNYVTEGKEILFFECELRGWHCMGIWSDGCVIVIGL